MRLLHTSDWHVGKAIRGHSRVDEHRLVLSEIATIAATENVELIVVAGDLYETAAPSAESEALITSALLELAQISPVVVVSGNHDNARRLAAVAPLMELARITVASRPLPPAEGGRKVISLDSGVDVDVALLPFVSQRGIVRTADLMGNAAFENAQTYGDRMQRLIAAVTAGMHPDNVNIMVAHAFVAGAAAGGGERAAHIADEYGVSAVDFPPSLQYVALGHLHRPQQMLGATAIHYSGSPLQLDFGETEQIKVVNIADLEPGIPAKVRSVPLTSGRRLQTLTGTLADLTNQVEAMEDDQRDRLAESWIRARVTEASRLGLADDVRKLLGPGVVDVRIEATFERAIPSRRRDQDRSPSQLFGQYLTEVGVAEPRLERAFTELHDELTDSTEVAADQRSTTTTGGRPGETP